MSSGVFVLRDQKTLVAMRPASFASEDDFQRLLADFPALLAGEQIDANTPRQWLLVAREKSIPSEESGAARWSLDHLFLDQDGVPTLVEVKRSTDTRIRREVVGQMLDYAANCVVYWPVEDLRQQFEANCAAKGEDPANTITSLIGPERDAERFWDQVKTNLRAGRVRMLFVADQIPTELRRIVEFLNEQMNPAEVLALELRQFEGEGLKTLVPAVYGQTQQAQQNKATSAPKRLWDLESICAELQAKFGSEAVTVARTINKWLDDHTIQARFGTGPKVGVLMPEFTHGSAKLYPVSVSTDGKIWINFYSIRNKPPFDDVDRRREFLARLNQIGGLNLEEPVIESSSGLPISLFVDPGQLSKLLAALDWFAGEVRRS